MLFKKGMRVSVPYRGLILFNKGFQIAAEFKDLFPSPIGDLFYLMQTLKTALRKSALQFPSPIGDLFYLMKIKAFEEKIFTFPSPIGDLFYLIRTVRKR